MQAFFIPYAAASRCNCRPQTTRSQNLDAAFLLKVRPFGPSFSSPLRNFYQELLPLFPSLATLQPRSRTSFALLQPKLLPRFTPLLPGASRPFTQTMRHSHLVKTHFYLDYEVVLPSLLAFQPGAPPLFDLTYASLSPIANPLLRRL